jgi:hypothetical protein
MIRCGQRLSLNVEGRHGLFSVPDKYSRVVSWPILVSTIKKSYLLWKNRIGA